MPISKPIPAHLEARLYLLRALAHTTILRRLCPLQHRCRAMLDLLEIDAARANNRKEFRSLRTEIRQRLEKLEARWAKRDRDALDSALSDLQSRLGMGALERDALRLCVRVYQFEALRDGLDGLTHGLASRVRLLARILNTSEQEAKKLLDPENVLHRSGWLDAPVVESGLGECLRLQYETAELLLRAQPDGLNVLRACCRPVGFGVRSRESFHEVRCEFDVLAALLHAALRARTVGVNVLIHAPQAVGKTTLVQEIAHAAEVMLYEIPGGGLDGEPWNGAQRLTAYARTLRLFGGLEHALLVDDADEIFGSADNPLPMKWLHEHLESNARPVFWIVRESGRVPACILDRFSLVVALPEVVPPNTAITRGRHAIDLHPDAQPDWSGASLGQISQALRMAALLNPLLQHREQPRRGWSRTGSRQVPAEQSDEEIWDEIQQTVPPEAPERRTVLSTAALHLTLAGLRAARPISSEPASALTSADTAAAPT